MTYDELLEKADKEGLVVKEASLQSGDGRCFRNRIAIRKDIPTLVKKADVLAEEMGHYYTTVGDIINSDDTSNKKQERTARLWAYNNRIGLDGIVKAFQAQCTTAYEIAEYLEVSEGFLNEALECYKQIYGSGVMVDKCFLQFEPNLQIYKYHAVTYNND